jgi:hypothetical protein
MSGLEVLLYAVIAAGWTYGLYYQSCKLLEEQR